MKYTKLWVVDSKLFFFFPFIVHFLHLPSSFLYPFWCITQLLPPSGYSLTLSYLCFWLLSSSNIFCFLICVNSCFCFEFGPVFLIVLVLSLFGLAHLPGKFLVLFFLSLDRPHGHVLVLFFLVLFYLDVWILLCFWIF